MKINFSGYVLLAFIIFLIITYFENIYIGGISFASIWKAPFVLYGIYYTYIVSSKRALKYAFVTLGGLFCLLLPLHSNMTSSFVPEITTALKYIIIPTLFYYLIKVYNARPLYLVKYLYWLSTFLIWANVPYLMNILKPKIQVDFAQSFGEDMLIEAGFSGPYMTIHSQGVFMASACIFIMFIINNYSKTVSINKVFSLITFALGLYCLYLSFARTGWLLFITGFVVIFVNLKFSIKSIFILIFFLGSLYILYQKNDSFRKRLLDQRLNSSEITIDNLGSGRLVILNTAILNWWQSDNIFSLLIGYGSDKGKEKMKSKLGSRIFAHNGFVEILQTTGIVGLFLFLFFIYKIYNYIRESNSDFRKLSFALFFGWILVGIVQEFNFIYLNIFLSSSLAICLITNKNIARSYKVLNVNQSI